MNQPAWRPAAPIETLEIRARMLSRIRAFFTHKGVLEVDTPLLSQTGTTDPHIHSFQLTSDNKRYFLQTSPEFAMKRLLASGCGDIFQICKAFRRDEVGRYHNPEFTLLEWYRKGIDHMHLMDEVEALLGQLLAERGMMHSSLRLSFTAAFKRYADLDPLRAQKTELTAAADAHGIEVQGSLSTNEWLDLLFAQLIAPAFPTNRLIFIYDFPETQASLARIRPGNPSVAERFEVFWGPLELANGFHELTDSIEQRHRFEQERKLRLRVGLPDMPTDERLLAALAHGLPECAGVALGLDRVLMLMTNEDQLHEVLAFPWERA